ncbi:MAG: nitroreductase family protein [Trueperaceae bacterium]|nr:nitroreductase family protein [Trueperaceae bacterium]
MSNTIDKTAEDLAHKAARPDHDILDVFTKRWSPRAFADRAVEPEKLRQVLEAARWSASSYNEQPWHYIVATRHDPDAYDQLLGCLNEFNASWAKNAPVLMLAVIREFPEGDPDKTNRVALHDLGAASASLSYQATALGLYVHQMAGILPDEARKRYEIPDGYRAVTGLALGYLGDPDQLPGGLREGELSERSRKPLADFVFSGRWGESADLVD